MSEWSYICFSEVRVESQEDYMGTRIRRTFLGESTTVATLALSVMRISPVVARFVVYLCVIVALISLHTKGTVSSYLQSGTRDLALLR